MRSAAATLAVAALLLPVLASAAQNPLFDFSALVNGGASSTPKAGSSQVLNFAPPAAAPAAAPQSSLPLGVEEQVSVTQDPEIPKPGELVHVRIDSYSTNLSKATTVWLKDGVEVAGGRGVIEYSFVAPPSGESTTVTFKAIEEGGGALEKSVTVAPADVDIAYEALTYTPPLYRGKAMFTNSANIKFVAIPNVVVDGARVPAADLVYTWRLNGSVVQEASGYGRQTFITKGALVVNGIDVEVDVQAVRSPAEAVGYLTVNYASPRLLMYRKDPLLGVLFEKTWSGVSNVLEGTEFTLDAVPYSADTKSPSDSKLSYTWWVNNKQSNQAGPIATFRKEGGGIADISVTMKDAANFAQYAASAASVDLGAAAAKGGASL